MRHSNSRRPQPFQCSTPPIPAFPFHCGVRHAVHSSALATQTLTLNAPTSLAARHFKSVERSLSVPIILKDGFAPIASIHDAVNRTRLLHREFSCHAEKGVFSKTQCK